MTVSAIPVSSARVSSSAYMEEMQLIKGDLQTIPVNGLKRVSVTDPMIADIADANEEEVLLLAKEPGQTVMFIWEGEIKRTIVIRVVEEDLNLLARRIQDILNSANLGRGIEIKKSSYEGKVLIGGEAPEKNLPKINEILLSYDNRIINLVREQEIEDMIQIDMQITQLNSTLVKELGFKWFGGEQTVDGNLVTTEFDESQEGVKLNYLEVLPNLDGSPSDWFKVGDFYRGANSALVAQINALVVEGKAEVLSKPRIMVANGKEASLLVGGEIPIRTTTTNATGGSVQEDIEFKEYGVNLVLTPLIRKGKVDISLNVEVSDIDQSNQVGNDVAFTTSTAQTHLFLDSLETVVLAGLIKKNEAETVRRVPFLSKIPVLGALFRSRSTPESEQEIVISLTPTIKSDVPKFKNQRAIIVDEFSDVVDANDKPAVTTPPSSTTPTDDMMDDESYYQESTTSMFDDVETGSMDMTNSVDVNTQSNSSTTMMESSVTQEAMVSQGLVQPQYQDMPLVSKTVQVGSAIPAIMGPYVKDIQRKISEAISYPYEAQKNGWQGTVKMTLRILRNGTLDDVVLKETSGYAIFDQDALNTARILSPYDRFPEELNLEEIVVTVPIVYSMNSFLDNAVQQ